MLDLYTELKTLLATLSEERIDYALCGGLAMAVHGTPRATADIDLVVLAGSLGQLKALAHRLGFSLEAEPLRFAGGIVEIHRLTKSDPDSEDFLSLDLLLVTPALQEVWESRLVVEWEAGPLQVVSREGLIAQVPAQQRTGSGRYRPAEGRIRG